MSEDSTSELTPEPTPESTPEPTPERIFLAGMTLYSEKASIEKLERLVSGLENKVIVNITQIISTAIQVQAFVESEQVAFMEFLWIIARADVPLYNPMAIASLSAPRCLLMFRNSVNQYLVPSGTTRQEALDYKQLFTEGLLGLVDVERALNHAVSVCKIIRQDLSDEIRFWKRLIKLKKGDVTFCTIGESVRGFGIPHMLLKLDMETYHGRLKWASDLVKDVKRALKA